MASLIDLTNDESSADETPAIKGSEKHASNTRQPLNPIQNNVRLPPIVSLPSVSSLLPRRHIDPLLDSALHKASARRLRKLITKVCHEYPTAKALVEREMLVPMRDVVPYHADSASEDAEDGEHESGDDDNVGEQSVNARNLKRKAADLVGEELFPRFAHCENCGNEFDVTLNKRGDCVWHWGDKELCDEDDFWADHDDNCHGDRYSSELMNHPDFEDGYQWSCCEKLSGEEGCKKTKHKAAGVPGKKARNA